MTQSDVMTPNSHEGAYRLSFSRRPMQLACVPSVAVMLAARTARPAARTAAASPCQLLLNPISQRNL